MFLKFNQIQLFNMKKSLLGFLILLGTLVCNARVIEKKYTWSHYQHAVTAGYDLISFDGLMLNGLRGEPSLPYQAVALLLPPGEIVDYMEIIPGELVEIPGNFSLYPRQSAVPVSTGSRDAFYVNDLIYNSLNQYPRSHYGKVTTAFLRGYSIGMTTITPLVYFPKQGLVKYYTSMTVRFYTKASEPAAEALKNLRRDESSMEVLKSITQNPALIGQYPDMKTSSGDYQVLIITGSSYVSSFTPLVNLYLRRGLRSQVVSVSTLNAQMPGQDLQEKIRHYIIQEYQTHSIDYVILGGDISVVPYRGFYCTVQSIQVYQDDDIPSDLYYSALDGNWNSDNDQRWGEIGEDDLLPEVAVGRIPFSSVAEAGTMISKSISYQNLPVVQELNKVLLLGEKLMDNPLTWGGDYLDLLVGHQDENGYTTDGIYTSSVTETLYDRDLPQPWTVPQLLSKINEGIPFIHHSGHASTDYNMRLESWEINNNSFNACDGVSHNFCLVYSHGCYSGAFDDEDCIAEEMLKINRFAVAYTGNSRYGWFNEGQTEGPSQHLHREFVNALYHQEDYRLGETHRQSRINSASWVNAPGQWEEGALRWCYYDCNVLGDPVLGIWTAIPQALQVSYPASVLAYSASMDVQVMENSIPVAGVTCAFLTGNTLLGVGITNAQGNAQIVFDITPVNPGTAELVVSGYNRLATAYAVNITGSVGLDPQVAVYQEDKVFISPNPFVDNVSVNIDLVHPSDVSLQLFSPDGKLLGSIFQPAFQNGQYSIALDAVVSDLPAGIYFLKVLTDSVLKTIKIIRK